VGDDAEATMGHSCGIICRAGLFTVDQALLAPAHQWYGRGKASTIVYDIAAIGDVPTHYIEGTVVCIECLWYRNHLNVHSSGPSSYVTTLPVGRVPR
jgi:hypothetical protein